MKTQRKQVLKRLKTKRGQVLRKRRSQRIAKEESNNNQEISQASEKEEDLLETGETRASISGENKNTTKKGFFERSKIIFYKVKEITLSNRSFEEKVCLCMQYIVKEVTSFLCENLWAGIYLTCYLKT